MEPAWTYRWAYEPLDFSDLEFTQKRIWCKNKDGPKREKWIPVGMSRVPPEFQKCVFFLHGLVPDEKNPQKEVISEPVGTGVIVSIPSKVGGAFIHEYAVTNNHVVNGEKVSGSIIRVNTRDGSSRYIDLDAAEWIKSFTDDLAATDISDLLDYETDDIRPIPVMDFISEQRIKDFELGFGDDVFMIGLFANQQRKDINFPALRSGNLSMLADKKAKIAQESGYTSPCHVVDMRSRSGFSGSPVFIYRTPATHLRGVMGEDWEVNTDNNILLGLLGIHCGQYPEDVKVKKKKKQSKPRSAGFEGVIELEMPSSMTIVVPAAQILALLNDRKFRDMRIARDERYEERASKMPKSESALEDESPTHKEDFNRLLVEAVPKKQPKKEA